MEELQLELTEEVILETTDVERYGKKEDVLNEMILTNKNLIFIYDYKSGIFSRAEKKIDKVPLSDIKVLRGKAQVSKLNHDDYGNVMMIQYKNGLKIYYSFYDERKETEEWVAAICSAITEKENIVKELHSEKESEVGVYKNNGKIMFEQETEEDDIELNVSLHQKNLDCIYCMNCGEKLPKVSNFCNQCGSPVNQVQQNKSQRQQEYVGKVYKCPNCGSVITNMTAICPDCGMKISKDDDMAIFRRFQQQMIEIESEQKSKGILNIYKDIFVGGNKNPKVALIKNYPIPDSVDCIVEFMIYATTSIEDTRSKDEALAWYSKMKQMYMKAKRSFPKDPAFKDIKEMYLVQKEEYDWA